MIMRRLLAGLVVRHVVGIRIFGRQPAQPIP